jgi:transposase InsO family protein
MKTQVATQALNSAVARRGEVAGCILHTDRGSQFRSRKFLHASGRNDMVGSLGRVGAAGDNAAMESFFSLPEKSPAPALGHPRTATHCHRHLDRTHLPPASPSARYEPVNPQKNCGAQNCRLRLNPEQPAPVEK